MLKKSMAERPSGYDAMVWSKNVSPLMLWMYIGRYVDVMVCITFLMLFNVVFGSLAWFIVLLFLLPAFPGGGKTRISKRNLSKCCCWKLSMW